MKYRKRPVVIEAWKIKNVTLEDLLPTWVVNAIMTHQFNEQGDGYSIATLEGKMHAEVGDYLIKGIHGELYSCKPDIFEETYEAVNDD